MADVRLLCGGGGFICFKKLLVTGAGGFIGSHLTESLVRGGYSVRAFVMYNSFNSWGWLDHAPTEIIKSIEIFAGDIRDPHGVNEAMRGCDLARGLQETINWFTQSENLQRYKSDIYNK